MMSNEAKHKHLEFIQGTISRLGNNGFHAKSWSITIVSAILALAASKESDARLELLLISIIPIIIFWVLDGYFLWQERLFRELYKDVSRINEDSRVDFQMNLHGYNSGRNTWMKSIFSKTLNIFYISLLILVIMIACIIQIV